MRGLVPRRALSRAMLLTAAGSLTTFALAVPASAKPTAVVHCAHLNASAPKHNVVRAAALSGCTVPRATGGGGKVSTLSTTPASGHATITWNKAGSTTSFDYKIFPQSSPGDPKHCPAHTKEFVVFGQVSGGAGAAATLIPNGQPISAEVCVGATHVINEPGIQVTI